MTAAALVYDIRIPESYSPNSQSRTQQSVSTNTTLKVLWPPARTPAERLAAMREAMDSQTQLDPQESAVFQQFAALPISSIKGFSLSRD
jgi:hypothetical protein